MAAIGLFMPSDLLFSFVIFFLLRKVTHVVLASQGIPQSTFSGTAISPGPPYFDEQTWGAVLAMFLGALWVSREYLKEVWRDIKQDLAALVGRAKRTEIPATVWWAVCRFGTWFRTSRCFWRSAWC
jgi:hypothetical protein